MQRRINPPPQVMKLYKLSNADSLLKKYQNREKSEELQVLPVRVEKSVVQELDEVVDNNPMIESRSTLVRAFLTVLVEEGDQIWTR